MGWRAASKMRRALSTPTVVSRGAWNTIGKYRVTHVVVGDMERRTYPGADAVAKFPFLQPVSTGETTIYAVTRPE